MKKRILSAAAILWALALAVVGASVLTANVKGSADGREITEEEQAMLDRYQRLDEVRKIIEENYYIEVNEEDLVQGAIDGMLAAMDDPYTYYYTVEDMEDETESRTGEYRGVGMSVQMDGEGAINVVRVFKDSPADKAGVYAGDKLIAIDGEMLNVQTAKDLEDAVALMRGVANTEVTLTMFRDGEQIDFTMKRGDVVINYVEYQMLDDLGYADVGYVRLYEFEDTTAPGFMEAKDYFTEQGAKGVLIDLRDNPGGQLASVSEIADAVLPKGRIVYTEDRAGNTSTYYSDADCWDIPIVVLINGNSASASEILAGAIQDYEYGTLVGTQSFGKGIVQLMMSFPDGAGMQYTEASYFTPSGRCIHKVGLEPDVVVELQEDYDPSIRELNTDNDNQLAEALSILQDKINGKLD